MLHIFSALLVLGVSASSQSGAAAVLDDSCRDAPMSLVQSRASSRGKAAASQEAGPKPWEKHYFFVGTHHKAGSNLLHNVMRRALDTLDAPFSCRWELNWTGFLTTADNTAACSDRLDIPIQFDLHGLLKNFAAAKGAASFRALPIRGAHAIRKPKDMLISAYCYHHRGEEYGTFDVPWPEIMSMGPLEGLMALWPPMSGVMQRMLDLYTHTAADEMFHVRFEEISKSSEGFHDVVQRLFHFLFADTVPESDLFRLWEAVKVEDLNVKPTDDDALEASNHSNDKECMLATQESLLQLDPRVLSQLKDMQEQLGYSIENWPDPVTS